jgi:hypothetical protein
MLAILTALGSMGIFSQPTCINKRVVRVYGCYLSSTHGCYRCVAQYEDGQDFIGCRPDLYEVHRVCKVE